MQLGALSVLLFLHLSYSAHEDFGVRGARESCIDDESAVHQLERVLYTAETALLLLCLLPAPVLAWAVSASSFAPIFAAWPYLLLSLLAIGLCAAILGVSFYIEPANALVKLGARQGGVQALTLVMLVAWLLPALKPRLLPRWRTKLLDLREDQLAQPHHRQGLERQLKLSEYMARRMGERLLEHQHRLSRLQLRLTLLNTPRQSGFLRAPLDRGRLWHLLGRAAPRQARLLLRRRRARRLDAPLRPRALPHRPCRRRRGGWIRRRPAARGERAAA